MNLDFSQHVTAPEDVLIRVLDGEAVILNLESESYFGLDDVGTRMWTVLTESTSIQAAYDLLAQEYDVSPEQLRTDLSELVTKLVENGLLELNVADPV